MLKVNNLSVNIKTNGQSYRIINDINFSVKSSETLGLVGESGCGKSITAISIMGLLRDNIYISSGTIDYDGKILSEYKESDYEKIRGNEISMIFQDSMSSLNPLMKVGKQIKEAYELHMNLSKEELKNAVHESLLNVGFQNPDDIAKRYPHQLSGGQRQRVMIAMAIACKPKLLIADEPTTALDVTTQNKILGLIKNIQSQNNMGIILISHDITVIYKTCSHVGVMYAGSIVEYGNTEDVIKNPKHPYTKSLIESVPSMDMKDRELSIIEGHVPALTERKHDICIFYDRCKYRSDRCKCKIKTINMDNNRSVMCTLYY